MEFLETYNTTIGVLGFTGLLLLVQILIADLVAIKQKHTPGYPVDPNHESFLFRATRAHSNTNETIAVFVLFALFGMLSGANAFYLNTFSMIYLIGRLAHMIFYYANLKLARSISFPVSLIGLIGMFVAGVLTLLG